jgi:predicted nucleic acid-binding protein
MPDIIILDSYPLSHAAIAFARPNALPTPSERGRQWIANWETAGAKLIVPAIAYYEELRELERRGAAKIARFKQFCFLPGRFLTLETSDLELAAQLWGQARNRGIPTASDDDLDGDMILAAQVLALGLADEDYVVATSNVRHLKHFVNAEEWSSLVP